MTKSSTTADALAVKYELSINYVIMYYYHYYLNLIK